MGDSGFLLTNFHVVEGTTTVGIKLFGTGEVLQATKARGYDLDNDLVALQVDGANVQSGTLGDSDKVYTGQPVVVEGNPEGLEQTISNGLSAGYATWPAESFFKSVRRYRKGVVEARFLTSKGKSLE